MMSNVQVAKYNLGFSAFLLKAKTYFRLLFLLLRVANASLNRDRYYYAMPLKFQQALGQRVRVLQSVCPTKYHRQQ